MWETAPESQLPRRLIKTHPVAELDSEDNILAFLRDNKNYIL